MLSSKISLQGYRVWHGLDGHAAQRPVWWKGACSFFFSGSPLYILYIFSLTTSLIFFAVHPGCCKLLPETIWFHFWMSLLMVLSLVSQLVPWLLQLVFQKLEFWLPTWTQLRPLLQCECMRGLIKTAIFIFVSRVIRDCIDCGQERIKSLNHLLLWCT